MAGDMNVKWTNGKTICTGRWSYYWAGDYFNISIDKRVKGLNLRNLDFRCYNDSPEWGNWKLLREKVEE